MVMEGRGAKWWCVGGSKLEVVSEGVWSGRPSCVSGYLAGSGYRPRRQVLQRSHATLPNLQWNYTYTEQHTRHSAACYLPLAACTPLLRILLRFYSFSQNLIYFHFFFPFSLFPFFMIISVLFHHHCFISPLCPCSMSLRVCIASFKPSLFFYFCFPSFQNVVISPFIACLF